MRPAPDPSEVLAIFCADLHIDSVPPIARAAEPDWYDAVRRPLKELRGLQQRHGCPVVIAGDLFNRWNVPPEAINFALAELPDWTIAVPGNHELPYHRYEDVRKSAYWTLVEAGRVADLDPRMPAVVGEKKLVLHGFPYGVPVKPIGENRAGGWTHVAVVHAYCWIAGADHPGADPGKRAKRYLPKLEGYDHAFFGDNHVPFHHKKIVNCGGFLRRRADEKTHRPRVWLLTGAGVQEHLLDCRKDVFTDPDDVIEAAAKTLDLSRVMEELKALGDVGLNFVELLTRYAERDENRKAVREFIFSVLEGKR